MTALPVAAIKVAAHQQADILGFTVVAVGDAVLGVDFDAVEVLLQAEVDDAGDGVRTVGGGFTAGHDFDALNQARRNGVQVDRAVRVGRRDTAAIHQDQGAVGAEAAQFDLRLAGTAGVVGGGGHGRNELGQFVQKGFDRHDAGILQGFSTDRHDRGVGPIVLAGDARAGDNDFFDFSRALFGCKSGGRHYGEHRQTGQDGRRQKAFTRLIHVQDFILQHAQIPIGRALQPKRVTCRTAT